MKKGFIICICILLLSGCQSANTEVSQQANLDEESKRVEETPRFIGAYKENELQSYATRVRNLQNSKGTYEYFIHDHLYGDGRAVQVKAGEAFEGFIVDLKKNQKLIVELGKWNKTGSAIEVLETKTVTNGGDTAIIIPEGAGKYYFYRLALIGDNGDILKENYFPLYTPTEENNIIATASKQVYKTGEIASVYYENWGMNELETGEGYKIYKETESGWQQVNQDMGFTEQLIVMGPSSVKTEHINLKGLEKGTYKVLKGFSRQMGEENAGFQIGVEFEISNNESK